MLPKRGDYSLDLMGVSLYVASMQWSIALRDTC